MDSLRPLIVLRAGTNVSDLAAAVRTAACPQTRTGLVLIEAPQVPKTPTSQLCNVLDQLGLTDTHIEDVGRQGQRLANELSQIGLRFRVEVARNLTPSAILEHAGTSRADLIITGRTTNIGGRLLRYLREDTQLMTESPISVWLCGARPDDESPVLAAVDPDARTPEEIENNSRVTQLAFALANRTYPMRAIRFMAVCGTQPDLVRPSVRRARAETLDRIQQEVLKSWLRYAGSSVTKLKRPRTCMPVRMTTEFAPPPLLAMKLNEIHPCVIVTGKPLRSTFSRFLKPGMLSTFVEGRHSVLTVGGQIPPAEMPAATDSLKSGDFPFAYQREH